jgi:hypothetical protein
MQFCLQSICIYVFYDPHKKVIIYSKVINLLYVIMAIHSVLYEVETEFLNTIWTKSYLKRANSNKGLSPSFSFFFFSQQPPVGHGLLIHEVSRLHTTTQHSR